jgi:hypothetical protein
MDGEGAKGGSRAHNAQSWQARRDKFNLLTRKALAECGLRVRGSTGRESHWRRLTERPRATTAAMTAAPPPPPLETRNRLAGWEIYGSDY